MGKCRVCKNIKNREEHIVHLYTSHGIPIDEAKDWAKENNAAVRWDVVEVLLAAHNATGRRSVNRFKDGLGDWRKKDNV